MSTYRDVAEAWMAQHSYSVNDLGGLGLLDEPRDWELLGALLASTASTAYLSGVRAGLEAAKALVRKYVEEQYQEGCVGRWGSVEARLADSIGKIDAESIAKEAADAAE